MIAIRPKIFAFQIIKFHGSSKDTVKLDGRPMYANLRAEASFVTKDRGYAGKCSINEQDKELIDDLMEEEFFKSKQGLLQIEPKEDLKERLDRSPGRGDAYKMLQWAFDQEIEDKTYKHTEINVRPKYGLTDNDIDSPSGDPYRNQRPAFGRTD